MNADRIKNIHAPPPDDEAAEVGGVVLPKAFPGGGSVAEDPAIVEEKANDRGQFGGDQGGDRHGEAGHFLEDIEQGKVKPGEKETNNPPPHHRFGEKLVDAGFDRKGSHGRFSERAIAAQSNGETGGVQPGQQHQRGLIQHDGAPEPLLLPLLP